LYAIVPQVESQLNIGGRGAGKALAIFPGALGDFVCFLPALHEIARGRNVDLLARSEYADLLPPEIDAMSIERRAIARLFVAGAAPGAAEEFFRPYDAIYSWSGSADATFRANFARAAGAKGRLFPFRPAISTAHISDYYLACVGAAPGTRPKIALRPAALERAREWLSLHGFGVNSSCRTLLVAPGSGAKEKNWPREFFRAVIESWERSGSGKAAVILGPAEDDEIPFWSQVAPVARNLDLAELAALLSLADVYLGNDSGVTHLAAAVGAEAIVLFGPTDAAAWAPRGETAHLLSLGVECSPCNRTAMKSCPHRKCLTALPARDILSILHDILRQNPSEFPILDKGVGSH
jgi:ADP-heptose:LPS heptosyltransferase